MSETNLFKSQDYMLFNLSIHLEEPFTMGILRDLFILGSIEMYYQNSRFPKITRWHVVSSLTALYIVVFSFF